MGSTFVDSDHISLHIDFQMGKSMQELTLFEASSGCLVWCCTAQSPKLKCPEAIPRPLSVPCPVRHKTPQVRCCELCMASLSPCFWRFSGQGSIVLRGAGSGSGSPKYGTWQSGRLRKAAGVARQRHVISETFVELSVTARNHQSIRCGICSCVPTVPTFPDSTAMHCVFRPSTRNVMPRNPIQHKRRQLRQNRHDTRRKCDTDPRRY